MLKPDYSNSIVNLMASVIAARGGHSSSYPRLAQLDHVRLSEVRHLVLLVIDGLGHRFLIEHGRGSAMESFLNSRLTSVFPSTTASAIPSFLTGLAPQQHGLTGWFMHCSEIDQVVTVLPYQSRSSGLSLVQQGHAISDLLQPQPVTNHLTSNCYAVAPERIAKSPFNLAYNGQSKVLSYIDKNPNQMFDKIRSVVQGPSESSFTYAYWPDLDSIAHEHGIRSSNALDHFATLDRAFSQFMESIKGSDTIMLITADHGMVDSEADKMIDIADHPRLVATLAQPLCGEPRAAYCYVKQDMRVQFENYVNSALSHCATLVESATLLEQGYFGVGKPHHRLAQRIGDYTLLMKTNYVIKDWLPNEHRHVHIGNHGGLSAQELYVPLIVVKA